ncbi:DUF445 domain-containing protein [Novispirillum sp. DQ9]|uniref:DUF445 domain-containing protein n=1 Tax=Novispirillum sp. DQ9 TaxID=3398612 RepID=UPI003C7C922D
MPTTTPFPATGGDAGAQGRALRRHRLMATGLLVAMVALFIATVRLPDLFGAWTGLVRAAAEAALIGGLADWFAVTALFRRPLGLPIPHTGLIPRNKDRIGRRLGQFVTSNFLEPSLVHERMRSLGLARRAGDWLAEADNARRAADRIAALLPALLRATDDAGLRDQVRRALAARLRAADIAPLASRLLDAVPDRERDRLVDRIVALARDALIRNEARIHARVAERNSWWIPSAVDRKVARGLIDGVHDLLDELADSQHPTRVALQESLDAARARLRDDPEQALRLNAVKNRLLRDPQVQALLGRLWDEVRGWLLDGAERPDSRLRHTLADSLQALGRRLREDDALRQALDDRVERAVGAVLLPWRAEIGAFIEDVVKRWDASSTAARIELEVGKDLQYIRINGTVVGALVGAVLYLLVHA